MHYNVTEPKAVSCETLFKKGGTHTDRKEIYEIFKNTPLFKNSLPSTIDYAVKSCSLLDCKKGDIFDPEKKSLFVLLNGTASVYGASKKNTVILNTLKKGRVFGMASLFGEKCDTTSIIAKDNCTYALLTQQCVEEMLRLDVSFTKNYICFLSDKIRFLNKKIAFFTSGSSEKKVAGYILSLPLENNTVKLDMSLSKLAATLDIGRASLYRALDSLEENCFISRQNNVIKITSYDEFKKIYGESL